MRGATDEPAAANGESSNTEEEPVLGFLGEASKDAKKKKKGCKSSKKDSKKKKKDSKKSKAKKDKKKKKRPALRPAVPLAHPTPRRQFFASEKQATIGYRRPG